MYRFPFHQFPDWVKVALNLSWAVSQSLVLNPEDLCFGYAEDFWKEDYSDR